MPYIKPIEREVFDKHIHTIDLNWQTIFEYNPGVGNYIFSKILKTRLQHNMSYKTINEMIGMLECIKLELYRKLAAEYEDKKEEDNGGI